MSHSMMMDFRQEYNNAVNAGSLPNAAMWMAAQLKRGVKERFCQVLKVSPLMAEQLLLRNTHNRPVVQGGVSEYTKLMQEGRWRLTIEAIGLDKEGTLLNGQHRLLAIVASRQTVHLTVWFGLETDEFLFIDQGRRRSAAHLITLNGQDNGALRASLAGMIIWVGEGNGKLFPAQVVAEKSLAMDGACFDFCVTIAQRMKKITSPTAAGLAAHWLLENNVSMFDVEKFCGLLVSGEGLNVPMARLRDWLIRGPMSHFNNQAMTVKRAAAIILAWNAVKRNRRTLVLDWDPASKLPDVFA